MASITWIVIFLLVAVFAFYSTRMAKQANEDDLHDSGLAIVEFGRAFPNEAIRSLHATEDGRAVFVRLHDNKAGLMRNMRSHYACHLIEPGTVRVSSAGPKRLSVQFANALFEGGTYEFRDEKEAAEVSLWLLGSFMPGAANLAAEPVSN